MDEEADRGVKDVEKIETFKAVYEWKGGQTERLTFKYDTND